MMDALGTPQTLLLLGGTSDIAVSIAKRYAADRPLTVVLAARPTERRSAVAAELGTVGCTVREVDFDAVDHASHRATVEAAFAEGDIDIAVVAFGLLGDAEQAWQDPELALELAQVNYTAPVHVGVLLAEQMKAQRHGSIVALSSVAGERVRRSNFVYGSTKAGMDGFYTGLGYALDQYGVHVLVVRPGFVKSKMTEGMAAAPLATTPDEVAELTVKAVRGKKSTIWAPPLFRLVMLVLKAIPTAIFRKLSF
ncbi:decaprenylphospho-beta-D-erythro-pentofuranosid-2-ulose 2-reductase [Propionibacteriaceae bacterium Y2011]|uniref:decaprenylphospho-beta-D-erythro-pentofuranosid- 2-ulose 2-reductase n=1 Tax=Microlunatus sp. Y2014 TaxID=3418488 RepID=UPI003B4CC078